MVVGQRELRRVLILCAACAALLGCAGPHGERAALDNAVSRPGAERYGFSGGYVGATGGGFRN